MTKTTDRHGSAPQHSTTILWISLVSIVLLLAILLESVCLAILYVNNSLKGQDNSMFAQKHFLTSLLVSSPPVPALPPGVHFIGYIRPDRSEGWAQFLVADDLLGYRLAAAISVFYLDPFNKY